MFTLFAVLSSVSIGLRYVLPVFPLLHVLVSRLVRDGGDMRGWAKAGLVVLVAWQMLGTMRIHPHYLAHFNELVGGPRNGYKYLADSNLDWGQDLKGLKRYMDEHGIDRIRLAYFGAGDADYYGIDYDYLPSVGLHPPPGSKWWFETTAADLPPLDLSKGPTAISATLVAGIFLDGYYAWLREVPPSDQVGYSILIYEPQ